MFCKKPPSIETPKVVDERSDSELKRDAEKALIELYKRGYRSKILYESVDECLVLEVSKTQYLW